MQNRSRRSNFGKRWLRRILAVLLGLLLFAEVGAVRAQGDRLGNDGEIIVQSDAGIDADRLFNEGNQLYRQGTAEARQQAIQKLEQARELYRTAGDQLTEAKVLNIIGLIYMDWGKHNPALNQFQQALHLLQALDINDEIRVDILGIYNNIGEVYRAQNNYDEALGYFHLALLAFNALNESIQLESLEGVLTLYSNLGLAYLEKSEYEEAINYLKIAESIFLLPNVVIRNRESIGLLLSNNLGLLNHYQGNYQEALGYYSWALKQLQSVPNVEAEILICQNIGAIYKTLGDYEKALINYEQALSIAHDWGHEDFEALIYANAGVIYLIQDNLPKALEYFKQSLNLSQNRNSRIAALAAKNLGEAYIVSGDDLEAQRYLILALSFAKDGMDSGSEAGIYTLFGILHRNLDNWLQALFYLQKSLTLSQSENDRSGMLIALGYIAEIEARQGDFEKALFHINGAINAVEELRTNINDEVLRTSYFATKEEYYRFKIHLLMKLGREKKAFNTSEQSRARTLIELLAESNINSSQATDDSDLKVLYERKRGLEAQLSVRENLIQNAQSEEIRAQHQQEYNQFELELKNIVEPQIKQKDPAYAAIRYPTPLTLDQVQQNMLDDNTVLLQYAIDKGRSYLFAVTRTDMTSYILPDRTEIEAAAGKFLDGIRLGWRESKILQRGDCLRQKILPKEVLQMVAGKKLVIAADGILQTVPFAALPLPDFNAPETDACNGETFKADGSQAYQPLICEYEIINIPSITSVQILRAQQQAPAPKKLAILADPIFTTDPRTKQQAQLVCENTSRGETNAVPPETLPIELQAALRSTGGILNPLPCTRSEANAILEEINDAPQTLEALDYAATQDWVKTAPLSDYRIVHFATHGIIDDDNPGLSGLVLSQVDRQGKPIEDYYLRLNDIFNLKLNAELVVLSACETGLGEDVRGEGIIGLTRGFMYAGAKRVMTSFWKVEDGSTARLMAHFYHFMLKDNLSPSAALRQAQLEMRKEETSRANQWAAFTIQGEWN